MSRILRTFFRCLSQSGHLLTLPSPWAWTFSCALYIEDDKIAGKHVKVFRTRKGLRIENYDNAPIGLVTGSIGWLRQKDRLLIKPMHLRPPRQRITSPNTPPRPATGGTTHLQLKGLPLGHTSSFRIGALLEEEPKKKKKDLTSLAPND